MTLLRLSHAELHFGTQVILDNLDLIVLTRSINSRALSISPDLAISIASVQSRSIGSITGRYIPTTYGLANS